MGFLDDLPAVDLDSLPQLGLSTPPRRRRATADPVHALMAQMPQYTEAKYERLRVVCDQIYRYFMLSEIKEHWVRHIKEVAASAEPRLVFETDLQWPDDKAKFYAVMGVCAQRFVRNIVLIPEQVRETKWYKAHEWWVPEYICGMDLAPQFMASIEQDLREQGLVDNGLPGEPHSTQRHKNARAKQGSKRPGRPPKYTEKQKALARKRFDDLMVAGRQTLEAWAIVAEEHGFPSGDAARKQCG